jgi:hypothetical protein
MGASGPKEHSHAPLHAGNEPKIRVEPNGEFGGSGTRGETLLSRSTLDIPGSLHLLLSEPGSVLWAFV